MGASDLAERDLYSGLIKLAAAFVHDARGNPAGVRKNLVGARERLADAIDAGSAAGLDIEALVRDIDAALATGPVLQRPVAIARRPDGPAREA